MAIVHSRQFNAHSMIDRVQDTSTSYRSYGGKKAYPTVQVGTSTPTDNYVYNSAVYSGPQDWHSRMPEHFGQGNHAVSPSQPLEKGQQALFTVHHEPPKVDLLFAHEDLRHMVPGALGRVAMETHAKYGEYPAASGDLSPHSGRLVQNLSDKGIIKFPEHLDYPDFDNGVSDKDSYYRKFSEVPPEHSDAAPLKELPDWHQHLGSQFIRHVIRPQREKPQKAVEQPHLF